MDHRDIEDREVIERYLQGRLGEEETGEFEAHLLECGECFDKVRFGEDLGRALRVAAAEDVARAAGEAGILAWIRAAGRRRAAAWALVLALAVAPTFLFLRERARVAELVAPRINTPVFSLGTTRDGAVHRISLGASPEWMVLRLALPMVEHEAYRAVLRRADGEEIWRGDGLVPDAGDRLVLSFYSTLLEPGAHELVVTGTGEGDPTDGEVFRLEVVR